MSRVETPHRNPPSPPPPRSARPPRFLLANFNRSRSFPAARRGHTRPRNSHPPSLLNPCLAFCPPRNDTRAGRELVPERTVSRYRCIVRCASYSHAASGRRFICLYLRCAERSLFGKTRSRVCERVTRTRMDRIATETRLSFSSK